MARLLIAFLMLPSTFGWVSQRLVPMQQTFSSGRTRRAVQEAPQEENPCWQDLYDEDCSMDNVYSSSFVAGEWLKKMPCAEGIEDCDMPTDLKVPGGRQESGTEDVDVMGFLNLKRGSRAAAKKEATANK